MPPAPRFPSVRQPLFPNSKASNEGLRCWLPFCPVCTQHFPRFPQSDPVGSMENTSWVDRVLDMCLESIDQGQKCYKEKKGEDVIFMLLGIYSTDQNVSCEGANTYKITKVLWECWEQLSSTWVHMGPPGGIWGHLGTEHTRAHYSQIQGEAWIPTLVNKLHDPRCQTGAMHLQLGIWEAFMKKGQLNWVLEDFSRKVRSESFFRGLSIPGYFQASFLKWSSPG